MLDHFPFSQGKSPGRLLWQGSPGNGTRFQDIRFSIGLCPLIRGKPRVFERV